MNIKEMLKLIQEHIDNQNIKISDLASCIGVSEVTIYNWLANRREPTLYHLTELLEAIGLEVKLVTKSK